MIGIFAAGVGSYLSGFQFIFAILRVPGPFFASLWHVDVRLFSFDLGPYQLGINVVNSFSYTS